MRVEQSVGRETEMPEAYTSARRDGRRCLLNWIVTSCSYYK